ncbi:MAG: hypothetical protein EPO25_09325 [Gammaproteobacteria bacterium]|nr:MAG: hypothetical protein EPO25_09325 [Gammaproteobacteria bacterium]
MRFRVQPAAGFAHQNPIGTRRVPHDGSEPMADNIIGALIPIVAIVMGIGLAMISVVNGYRQRRTLIELHHRERLTAIEKGVEVPAPPEGLLDVRKPSPHAALLRGLVWLFVGVGLLFALPHIDSDLRYVGLIPVGVGLAYLIFYLAVGRREAGMHPQP